MNILAVGAAGFVGLSALAELHKAGHRIRIADTQDRLNQASLNTGDYEQIALDWPDTANLEHAIEDMDTVLHFAWTTNPASSMQDIETDAAQNILPSIRLAESCVKHRVKRLVFMSSGGTVYGNVAEQIIDESHSTNPLCAYGISKLSVEKYLQIFSQKYNLETISLRISNPYGKHQLKGSKVGAIASFLRHVHSDTPIKLFGDGGTVRDYIHIDDVSRAIAAAVDLSLTNNSAVFNISSGIGYSLQDSLEVIQSVTGKKATINRLPERRFDVRHIVLSSQQFQKSAGWSPEIELRDGIADMWEQLQSNINQRCSQSA